MHGRAVVVLSLAAFASAAALRASDPLLPLIAAGFGTTPGGASAVITGFALAFARGIGEYGSVVCVSGNMPYRTEIAPILIVARLEEFAYEEATAIAVVLLLASFALLVVINRLERWSMRHER